MRLLDVHTLQLHEFYSNIPQYAILSHTWTGSEVTFEELGTEAAERKTGFEKIKRCCALAAADGLQYVWIDTCCIDKRSSAELSEAINSMYRWYGKAQVCFAYLADVEGPGNLRLAESRWFTRGWTLQELVAPANVIFYGGEHWIKLGTKASLRDVISRITRIDSRILENSKAIFNASIAQRMSWASERSTTRIEDMAYCLLGIFDVNMPLLYGEGKKAFLRLQLELLNTLNDHSIFAWSIPDAPLYPVNRSANEETYAIHNKKPQLLAPSPLPFRDSANIRSSNEKYAPYHMTSTGLSITLPLIRTPGTPADVYLAFLNCYRLGNNEKRICLRLRHEGNSQFSRLGISEETLQRRMDWARPTPLFIKRKGSQTHKALFAMTNLPSREHGLYLRNIFSFDGEVLHVSRHSYERPADFRFRVALHFVDLDGGKLSVICGAENRQTWIGILTDVDEDDLKIFIQYDESGLETLSSNPQFRKFMDTRTFTNRKTMRLTSGKSLTVTLAKHLIEDEIQFNISVMIPNTENGEVIGLSIQPDERSGLLGRGFRKPQMHFSLTRLKIRTAWSVHIFFWTFENALGNKYFIPLMACVPLGVIAQIVGWNANAIFLLNLVALLPLGLLYNHILDILSVTTAQWPSALVTSLSRCTVEFLVGMVALAYHEVRIVQIILLGSIIVNILLTIGTCCLASGSHQLEQSLNSSEASKMLSVIAVAVAALVLPTNLQANLDLGPHAENPEERILLLSHGTALILLIIYCQYLYFQVRSPANFLDVEVIDDDETVDGATVSRKGLFLLFLAGCTLVIFLMFCASGLILTIRHFADTLGTSKTVIGFILIPLAINAGNLTRSIGMAARNRLDLAIYSVFQNTMQITLFIIPATVIVGWIFHIDMKLDFRSLEAMVFFISVLVVNYIVQTGKGSYLAGSLCTATYAIIALTLYCYPPNVND